MSNPFAGLFGGKQTASRINNPFDGLFANPSSPADQQQSDLLKQQQADAKKPKSESLFAKLGHVAKTASKDVYHAGKAAVRPVIDVATGQGGKAVHDTAQFSSDVTGGFVNGIANKAVKQIGYLAGPTRSQQGETSGTQIIKDQTVAAKNKAYVDLLKNYKDVGADASIQANHMATSGVPLPKIKAYLDKAQKAMSDQNKKAVGAALALTSLVPIGGAVKAAVAGKDLFEAAVKSGVSGLAGNEGTALEQNPDISGKDLAKAGAIGFGAGAVLPVAGKALGRALHYASGKERVTPVEASQKLAAAGYTPEESKAILSDALPEKTLKRPTTEPVAYNDESIKRAAADFDATRAPESPAVQPNPKEATTPSAKILPTTKPAASSAPTEVPGGTPIGQTPTPTEGAHLRPLQSIEENPEQGTSKLGSSVQASAIHDKLISKAEAEDLPTYNKADLKQQAQYATDLIKNNPQDAIDIALGKKEPPSHILPQMVYNAVEEYAKGIGGKDGGDLLLQLAKSKQVSSLTTMAQNVRAAGERDPHSPTVMINDLKVARIKRLSGGDKALSAAQKADKQAIKAVTPKINKDDWTAFVDELRC